jgi:hypothetical protein
MHSYLGAGQDNYRSPDSGIVGAAEEWTIGLSRLAGFSICRETPFSGRL